MAISGNATTAEGLPADFVRIFRWPTSELVGVAVPAESGDWSYEVPYTGEYGLTYIAAGCQPITHGPYLIEGLSDPHWDKVVALLRFDGDLTDETGRIWTPIGSPAFADTAPMLDGKYLTQGGVANSGIILGVDDFTIECFFRVRSSSPPLIFLWDGRGSNGSDGPYPIVYMQGSDRILRSHVNNGGTGPSSSVAVALNTPYHFAHVRKSGVSTFYLDGVNVGSAADATNYSLQSLHVAYKSSYFVDVLDMDEFRITEGVARYMENFTPPPGPFPNTGPA